MSVVSSGIAVGDATPVAQDGHTDTDRVAEHYAAARQAVSPSDYTEKRRAVTLRDPSRSVKVALFIASSPLLSLIIVAVGLSLSILMQGGLGYGSLLPVAFMCGVSQIGGRCGTAHVNTMSVIWRVDARRWLPSVLAYTLGGWLSSAAVAVAVATAGMAVHSLPETARFGMAALVAAALAVREVGLARFGLPQRDCQTNRNWASQYGWVGGAFLWGFHIGVSFDTVITYGGFLALTAGIVAIGDPVWAVAILTVYWVGRVTPLWTLSPISADMQYDYQIMFQMFRRANAVYLCIIGVVLVGLAM